LTLWRRAAKVRATIVKFFTFIKVKSNYFIMRPKVDQRTGLLSLPHLGNFRCTARSQHLPLLRKHSPEGDTGAQQCALLARLVTTHLTIPKKWEAE